MRLLKRDKVGWFGHSDDRFSLTSFDQRNVPPYAILSHRWGADGDEITFEDIKNGTGKRKAGYTKLNFCAERAARDRLECSWIDTCCIDKTNNTELQEAINSMFRWYHGAKKCYVYLPDVSIHDDDKNQFAPYKWESAFRKSAWFTRGWTLQELIAPKSVEFFSTESVLLGDKNFLEQQGDLHLKSADSGVASTAYMCTRQSAGGDEMSSRCDGRPSSIRGSRRSWMSRLRVPLGVGSLQAAVKVSCSDAGTTAHPPGGPVTWPLAAAHVERALPLAQTCLGAMQSKEAFRRLS